jgi:hypothetical protein
MSHKIIYEALQRLRFEAFLEALDDESRENVQLVVQAAWDTFFEDKLNDFIQSDQFADLIDRYDNFIAESSATSKTFAYWSIYIRMTGKAIKLRLRHKKQIGWSGIIRYSL